MISQLKVRWVLGINEVFQLWQWSIFYGHYYGLTECILLYANENTLTFFVWETEMKNAKWVIEFPLFPFEGWKKCLILLFRYFYPNLSGDARILKNWRVILCSIQKLQIEALYEEDFSPNRLRPLPLSIGMKKCIMAHILYFNHR